jgi:hypothetical protein
MVVAKRFSPRVLYSLGFQTSSVIPSIDAAFEHRLYLPMLRFRVRGLLISRFLVEHG